MEEICRRPEALTNFLGLREEDRLTKRRLNAFRRFRRYDDFPGRNQLPLPEGIPLGRGGIVRTSESFPCLNNQGPFSTPQELELGEFAVRRRLGLPTKEHFSRRSRKRYREKLREDGGNPPVLFLGRARVVFER